MENLVRKKVILCLLDCAPKPANEIAAEIDESLASVEDQLTALVSENICDKVNQGNGSQYVVKKDIETFAQLVKAFLSDKEEHEEQIEQFISSEYYFNRIDNELVDYVLKRFYLDSLYKTDENKQQIGRILLASPSALFFALHGDTATFNESWSHWNQLDSPGWTRDQLLQNLNDEFMTELSEMLAADMRPMAYGFLYDKLQIRLMKISVQVSLVTSYEKYVETIGTRVLGRRKVAEDLRKNLRPGQLITYVDPIDISDDGLAFLELGEFQTALKNFDDALNEVQDPSQKAIVLNNKGLTFLRLKQYQKAIECFEEGITSDSVCEFSVLRENKQLAEEYLARATDADNLTEPIQIRFVHNQPVPLAETRLYEFKEVKGKNPAGSITNTADEYAVAFLNSKGGRIFWGVRDSDRITVGVNLNERQRDDVRRKVSEKLWGIRPPISDEDWQLELHQVYNLHGETIEDLWVVELLVPPLQKRDVFYTNSGELFVKTEGGKQKLLGPQVTEFILSRLQNDTEKS